jgi:hypothetical protein
MSENGKIKKRKTDWKVPFYNGNHVAWYSSDDKSVELRQPFEFEDTLIYLDWDIHHATAHYYWESNTTRTTYVSGATMLGNALRKGVINGDGRSPCTVTGTFFFKKCCHSVLLQMK